MSKKGVSCASLGFAAAEAAGAQRLLLSAHASVRNGVPVPAALEQRTLKS